MIAHQKMSAQWLKFHIGVNFKVNWNVGTHNYLKDYKQHWKVSVSNLFFPRITHTCTIMPFRNRSYQLPAIVVKIMGPDTLLNL